MSLTNLRNRYCIVCDRRGDRIGKINLRELKNEYIDDVIKFFRVNIQKRSTHDLICCKHIKEINKKYYANVQNDAIAEETNVNENNAVENEEYDDNYISNVDFNNDCVGVDYIIDEKNNQDEYDWQNTSDECDTSSSGKEFFCIDNHESDNEIFNKKSDMSINIDRTVTSNSNCFICKAKNGKLSQINNQN